ncbi:MAG: DUF4136 domain-containing protein [Alphaproteobacteria bacterium]|nr:DUF4136 domain-containing protein [Alphaproteobacteria bacterium]
MKFGAFPRALARPTVLAALVGAALLSLAAFAQDKAPAEAGGGNPTPSAVVNAVSFQPLPERAVFAVRPLDNSDANLRLKVAIEEALRARGFGVAKESSLILSFDTRDEVGVWTDSGRRTILELQAQGGRDGGEYAHAKVNVFDSASGGLLNEGRGGTSIATPSTYRIDATVDDRTNGRRLWQGWAIANLSHGDRTELDRAMIPAIVQNVGRSVTRQPFELK